MQRPEFWVVFVEFWGEMLHDRRLRDLNTAVYTRTRRLIGRLIAEQAGHRALAAAMGHADHSGAEGGRLEAERAAERRRGAS